MEITVDELTRIHPDASEHAAPGYVVVGTQVAGGTLFRDGERLGVVRSWRQDPAPGHEVPVFGNRVRVNLALPRFTLDYEPF